MKKNRSQTTSSLISHTSYLNLPSSLISHTSYLKCKTTCRFTLVELLIVVAIIAILASMILPALRTALDKARAIQCISNHKQLSTTTQLYTDDNKGYMPFHPSSAPEMNFGSNTGRPQWSMFIWSYVTHKPIDKEYPFDKVNGDNSKQRPRIEMLRCPAVLNEPFNPSVEMKHIGRNYFLSRFESNLFISKSRWASERMLYSDYYATTGWTTNVANYTSGGSYTTVGYMTYLHPGLTATVTHLDGHVKAWRMHAVPQGTWDSRFWGNNSSCTGVNP